MRFTLRCIFPAGLQFWSHLVPISFWNPSDIDSCCYLYYMNLPFPMAKNAPLGVTQSTYSCGQKGLTVHRTIVVKLPLLRAV